MASSREAALSLGLSGGGGWNGSASEVSPRDGTGAGILTAARLKAVRRVARQISSASLLADVFDLALRKADLKPSDVDGLGVSSFGIRPDRAIDLAWRLGLRLTWVMEDVLGMNLFYHAVRAIQSGDARTIALIGGDALLGRDFGDMVDEYNVATRDYLKPLPAGGPNGLFALVTQSHMDKYGLSREAYGQVVVSQRKWAGTNPEAAYREPLTMEEYLSAPLVADPLGLFDCPPLVAGAEAVILTSDAAAGSVKIRSLGAYFNHDHQEGDGTVTGLAVLAPRLWATAGLSPADVDVVQVYDDYPVMVLVQLADLGLLSAGKCLGEHGEGLRAAVNTSGGLLCAGQSGAGGGLHGLVEAVLQLRQERGAGQVAGATHAVVAGYGMVLYRYGACSVATVLSRGE